MIESVGIIKLFVELETKLQRAEAVIEVVRRYCLHSPEARKALANYDKENK